MNVIAPKRPKTKIRAKEKPLRPGRVRGANARTEGFSAGAEFNTPKRRKTKITAKETQLRFERVRRGEANNRIEGILSGPESNTVFAAYIRGDIEVTEIVPQLKRLYCAP
jgi:hypothetical protein